VGTYSLSLSLHHICQLANQCVSSSKQCFEVCSIVHSSTSSQGCTKQMDLSHLVDQSALVICGTANILVCQMFRFSAVTEIEQWEVIKIEKAGHLSTILGCIQQGPHIFLSMSWRWSYLLYSTKWLLHTLKVIVHFAGCCFIKYSTVEEAERAIRALNNQHTLPGVCSLSCLWFG
jgi:hypothetical protein